jgi:HlyD family secretion protein
MRSLLLLFVLPLILLAAIGAWWGLSSEPKASWQEYPLQRGEVHRDAVAVGRLEPIFEIPVTATNGGVVTQIFVELGQRVQAGAPLIEVRPVLSDRQRLQAERQLLAAREAELSAEEIRDGQNLMGGFMRLLQGDASMQRMGNAAARGRSGAEEQVQLLLDGRVEVDGHVIDWVVRAQNSGHVLQLDAEVGMPVVPASQFGAGTVLCVLGDLDRPVFRGTIDELDAGKLQEGMAARVVLGALPNIELAANVSEISLRGVRLDNAVSFPIELQVSPPADLALRAGYSAVARIEIERVRDEIVIPERFLSFEAGTPRVRVRGPDGEPVWREIELGLGDGLRVAVLAGLDETDVLLEQVD